VFTEVLFPLITQLLKPEVYQSDPLGMSETRVRAATLLSKVFLHYLVLLGDMGGKELLDLWLKIVTIMDRLINSGQGDNLVRNQSIHISRSITNKFKQEEAVSENLKNMLLVMSNGGYLAPPDEKPEQEELWNETWKRVNRFLPNFFEELFPEEAAKPKRSKEVPIREKEGEKGKQKEVGEGEKHEGEVEKAEVEEEE
jgi:brefeldin A-resistance guanine nucleotide exchange factor 1